MDYLKWMVCSLFFLFALLILLVPFLPGLTHAEPLKVNEDGQFQIKANMIKCYEGGKLIFQSTAKTIYYAEPNMIWFEEKGTHNQVFLQNLDCIIKVKH